MTQTDRQLLALLAVGVGLVYVSSLHFGSEFGWPGLTTGSGKSGRDGGKAAAKPPSKGAGTQKHPNRQNGRQGGPTKPDDGVVVDVSNPKVISVDEWKARRKAIDAARARKKSP